MELYIRERDTRERDVRERDTRERDTRELATIKNYMENEIFSCDSKITIIQLHYLPYIKKTIKKISGKMEIKKWNTYIWT